MNQSASFQISLMVSSLLVNKLEMCCDKYLFTPLMVIRLKQMVLVAPNWIPKVSYEIFNLAFQVFLNSIFIMSIALVPYL